MSLRSSAPVAGSLLLAGLLLGVPAAFVTLAPGAAAATTEDPLTPEERAWLEAHGPIRFAPDPDYPPFESVSDSGNVSGINVDLLNRMSRNLRFDFEIVLYENWTMVLEAMKAGEVDLLGATAATEEREPYMDFVGPYMRVGEVFYVRTDSPELTKVEDLVGKRVGVIPNYAAATWLATNHPELTTVPVEDMEDGLAKLSVGAIDAFFENIPVGGYYIRENALNNVRIMGEPLYYSDANWVVPEGNRILASIIAKGMASIPPGEQTRVFEYWTGYDLGITPPVPPAQLSPMWRNLLIGLVAVAALTGAWSFSLRRTVARRTLALKEANAQLARDNERRLAAEREVRRLNADLERRVEERTRELEEANRDLEAFSYTVSHDLRTPLAVVASYGQILDRKYADRLGEEGRRYVARALAASGRMAQLIDDVLRFSRAGRAPMDEATVDLTTVARQAADSVREKFPGREVDLDVAEGMIARGDERLLRIAIENLLDNAWKYTRDAQHPHVEVATRDTPDGREFYVRDNGAGFDAEKADRLFQTFQRLHEPSEFEGTGIGLSTVRRIVERHGGRVRAEGARGAGATFAFTLPDGPEGPG